jgi:hypothetical protein
MQKKKHLGSNYQLKQKKREEGHDTSRGSGRFHVGRALAQQALEGAGPRKYSPSSSSSSSFVPSGQVFGKSPHLKFDPISYGNGEMEVVFDNGVFSTFDVSFKTLGGTYRMPGDFEFSFDKNGDFVHPSMPGGIITNLLADYINRSSFSSGVSPLWLHVEKDLRNPVESQWYLRPNATKLDTILDFKHHPNQDTVNDLNERIGEFNQNLAYKEQILKRINLKTLTPDDLISYGAESSKLYTVAIEYQELKREVTVVKSQLRKSNALDSLRVGSFWR